MKKITPIILLLLFSLSVKAQQKQKDITTFLSDTTWQMSADTLNPLTRIIGSFGTLSDLVWERPELTKIDTLRVIMLFSDTSNTEPFIAFDNRFLYSNPAPALSMFGYAVYKTENYYSVNVTYLDANYKPLPARFVVWQAFNTAK